MLVEFWKKNYMENIRQKTASQTAWVWDRCDSMAIFWAAYPSLMIHISKLWHFSSTFRIEWRKSGVILIFGKIPQKYLNPQIWRARLVEMKIIVEYISNIVFCAHENKRYISITKKNCTRLIYIHSAVHCTLNAAHIKYLSIRQQSFQYLI